jgi:adenosylcobinamide kinase/adenosylcobinamide-phosphate guanylyltransferase
MSLRHLVLGAARSGKTRIAMNHAAAHASQLGVPVTYVATAEARDDEMQQRIARHRAERPDSWRTQEAPLQLAAALAAIDCTSVIVVDCLTLWLTNALLADFDAANPRGPLPTWAREREAFFAFLDACRGTIVLVSNEVGGGIVPESALARRFQDEQGWLNQRAAQLCDRVTLAVAGLELAVKA